MLVWPWSLTSFLYRTPDGWSSRILPTYSMTPLTAHHQHSHWLATPISITYTVHILPNLTQFQVPQLQTCSFKGSKKKLK